MKKRTILFFLPCIICFSSYAQEFRLNAYSSYVFDNSVSSYYSSTSYFDGKIKGGFRWGVGTEYLVHPGLGIELKYLQQNTSAPVTYYDYRANRVRDADLDFNESFIMLGANGYKRQNNFEPYAGMHMGVALLNAKNTESGGEDLSATKFAWDIHLGTNIFFSEKVGIKLQADLVSAVQGVGGGLYFGTGGVSTGVSSYSTMLQFGLGGGLVFRFPKTTTQKK
jgi:hypothetical protein